MKLSEGERNQIGRVSLVSSIVSVLSLVFHVKYSLHSSLLFLFLTFPYIFFIPSFTTILSVHPFHSIFRHSFPFLSLSHSLQGIAYGYHSAVRTKHTYDAMVRGERYNIILLSVLHFTISFSFISFISSIFSLRFFHFHYDFFPCLYPHYSTAFSFSYVNTLNRSLSLSHSLTPFQSFNYPNSHLFSSSSLPISLPLSLPPPGFVLSDPSLLPSTRQYNKSRGSKVYIKVLRSQRDVDAEELLWNV